jgi:polyhydroxybutyrate depolymerase
MKTLLSCAFAFVAFMTTSCTAPGADAASANTPLPMQFGFPPTLTINVHGETRKLNLEAPIGVTGQLLPVAIILHGGGGSADVMQKRSQSLSRQLRAQGYLVAYLNGSTRWDTPGLRSWNAGHCCAWALKSNIDETSYVDAVLDELSAHAPVDLSETILIGHSNGAMLAYRIASELKIPPKGIIAISGAMFADQPALPARTSVLAIHTRDDTVISLDGTGPDASERWRSAPHISFAQVETRLQLDKACDPAHTSDSAPGLTITISACEQGSRVETIIAETGGHEWPKSVPGFDLETAVLSFIVALN